MATFTEQLITESIHELELKESYAYHSFWATVRRINTERGHDREEYYNGSSRTKETFGLNKRTRRFERGINCSLPDGSWPKDTERKAA